MVTEVLNTPSRRRRLKDSASTPQNKPASIQELVDQTEKLKIYVFETINR